MSLELRRLVSYDHLQISVQLCCNSGSVFPESAPLMAGKSMAKPEIGEI